ncbi:MAG: RdgB/HAM1 family non-canonical purine NTP pyrophosphatase [Patescibacteria group bacterium]
MDNVKLVFATRNQGKLKEIRTIFDGNGFNIVSAVDAGVTDEVEEDGATLEENALKKARHVFAMLSSRMNTPLFVAAEDTGLFIDMLDGEPGVRTARWPGENGDHAAYTLERMKGVASERRTARFRTVLVLIDSHRDEQVFEGNVEGRIPMAPRGTSHPKLPYDSVFEPFEGDGRTFAEMSESEKNILSHRARACAKLKEYLHNT